MKQFSIPRMELIRFAGENMIITSICSSKYCSGFTCDQCSDDDTTCYSVSPCSSHNCGHVLCVTYKG